MNSRRQIVALSNGIGNQMFQYAFGRALESKKGCTVEFDTYYFSKHTDRRLELTKLKVSDHVFRTHPMYNRIRLVVQRIPGISRLFGCYKEYDEFDVVKGIVESDYRFYSGYWQNRDYFSGISDIIKTELTYDGTFSSSVMSVYQRISQSDTIAVHVRRGDYLSSQFSSKYAVQGEEYYAGALEMASKLIGSSNPMLYFFSDDIDWCRDHFTVYENAVFIDDRISDSVHSDMFLMQSARCLIMSNSTFSWWSAWLSDREDKVVIMPGQWFHDRDLNVKAVRALHCSGWILL